MKIHILLTQGALLFGFWSVTTNAFAKDTFQITLTTPAGTVSRGYSSGEDAINDLGDRGFSNLNPGYTSTSAASAVLDIRGLRALADYRADSTELTFQVPSLGITERFTGRTRDESQEMLEEYIKKNGNNILTRMLQALAAETPIDPVAGNPASLSGRMISDSFAAGTESFRLVDEAKEISNSVSVGLATGHFRAGDYVQNTFTLPLSYTIYFDNPGYQLRLDLPLNYTQVSDSSVYGTALGASLRIPLTDAWNSRRRDWFRRHGFGGGSLRRDFDQQLQNSVRCLRTEYWQYDRYHPYRVG